MEKLPNYLAQLTTQQRKAVQHANRPLMIVAGAGTGKTTVLTSRIAYLVSQGVDPSKILALTFTEKAATELETRLDELLPLGQNQVFASTFHGFGQHILTQFGLYSGVNDQTKVLTQIESEILLGDHIMDAPLDSLRPLSNPKSHVRPILQFISRCKDELISPRQLDQWVKSNQLEQYDRQTYLELAAVFHYYQALLQTQNLLDYGELLSRSHHLLKNHQDALHKLQQQFMHILVDEYQDTNFAQDEILTLLATKNGAITVVGDDDQSIYRFRGASVGQMERFLQTFPHTAVVTLTENFRSPQTILDAAYELIQHNNPYRLEVSAKINKKLTSKIANVSTKPSTLNPIPLYTFPADLKEAEWIVADITSRIEAGALAGDHCILTRTNAESNVIRAQLEAEGIVYTTEAGSQLKNEQTVQLLINFLKSVVNPLDALALFFLATSPVYGIEGSRLIPLLARNRATHATLESLLADQFTDESSKKLLNDLNAARNSLTHKPTSRVLLDWINAHDALQHLNKQSSDQGTHLAQVLTAFFSLIASFERSTNEPSVFHFLETLPSLLDSFAEDKTELNLSSDAVKLFTIHMAKGLEFPIVYITNLSVDRFPTIERHTGYEIPTELLQYEVVEGEHKREERRLMYVAMTRAKRELILTRAETYGKGRPRKASLFLNEFNNKSEILNTKNEIDTKSKPPPISNFEFRASNFPLRLSPHKIEDYQTCPLRYRYAHIDHLPVPDEQPLMVGAAIHRSIEYYFSQRTAGKKVTIDQLIKLLEDNWHSHGFISKTHEEARKQDALSQLHTFYDDFSKLPLPDNIEYPVELSLDGVLVNGRIDAVFSTFPDHSSGVIIDFKTSDTVRTGEQASKRADSSLQLGLYALAWQQQHQTLPELALYFPSSGSFGWTTRSERRLATITSKVEAVRDAIIAEDFDPTPSVFACSLCPFRSFCPASMAKD